MGEIRTHAVLESEVLYSNYYEMFNSKSKHALHFIRVFAIL